MNEIKVGDIVTRDGTDRHRVLEVGHYGEVVVECIKEPRTKWIKKDEQEINLMRRYTIVSPKESETK